MSLYSKNKFWMIFVILAFVCFSKPGQIFGTDIVEIDIRETAGVSQQDLYVTFGQVFKKKDISNVYSLGAKLIDGTIIPLQIDQRVLHNDGSLRHAVLTTKLPGLNSRSTEKVILFAGGTPESEIPLSLTEVLNSSYNVVVTMSVAGKNYTVSARDLLVNNGNSHWLSGPLATEWHVSDALKDNNGTPHPHLTARFYIRAFNDMESIRTDVIIENNWTFVTLPQNFNYDVTVHVDGKNTVLSEQNVTHYRQSRWRRVFWWGKEPKIHLEHDERYMMQTGAVPTYDASLVVPDFRFNEMMNWFNSGDGLMQIGYMESYMPAGGGRAEIAPLPRWTARYLISQDERAKKVMLGFGEQAGSWPIHYRDKNTDIPVSIDEHPDLTILGSSPIFPRCGGNCGSPYEPDMSHQPSLNYVPYLVTGDYFHLEELFFWANWNMFYGSPHRHGYELGLLSWDQIRGQAWGLRTLGHAAYITPDTHPLKSYFIQKLENNLNFYNEEWLDWNPLGYIVYKEGQSIERRISTWMDDFLTWSFGHLLALGFDNAKPFAYYKAKFPVGRMTHPDMCWILASTYWPTILTPYPVTGSSRPVRTWKEYHDTMILSWNDLSFTDIINADLTGREQDLINADCNSNAMASLLGLQQGEMIGYAFDPEGYPSNLQPALAVAVELGVENANEAWTVFNNRAVKPTWLAGEGGGYDDHPQWAIVPGFTHDPSTKTEFYSFTSLLNDGHIVLRWQLPGKTNHLDFEIERKTLNSKFRSIASLSGHDIQNNNNFYQYIDETVMFSHTYIYRIKAIDLDGSVDYSAELSVAMTNPAKFKLFEPFPNPFNEVTTIRFEIPQRSNISIVVFDITGKTLHTLISDQKMAAGQHAVNFNAATLSSGVYFFRVKAGNFWSKVGKLTLIK